MSTAPMPKIKRDAKIQKFVIPDEIIDDVFSNTDEISYSVVGDKIIIEQTQPTQTEEQEHQEHVKRAYDGLRKLTGAGGKGKGTENISENIDEILYGSLSPFADK